MPRSRSSALAAATDDSLARTSPKSSTPHTALESLNPMETFPSASAIWADNSASDIRRHGVSMREGPCRAPAAKEAGGVVGIVGGATSLHAETAIAKRSVTKCRAVARGAMSAPWRAAPALLHRKDPPPQRRFSGPAFIANLPVRLRWLHLVGVVVPRSQLHSASRCRVTSATLVRLADLSRRRAC